MHGVRIFWNTPSCSMDKINRNGHLLDSIKVHLGGPGAQKLPPIGHILLSQSWCLIVKNFLWSFLGVLIAPWHHPKLCQEHPCPQRLQKDQTFLTRSLSMSLKSFPGVFEEMDVPKKVRDDVRGLWEPPRKLHKIFFLNPSLNYFI